MRRPIEALARIILDEDENMTIGEIAIKYGTGPERVRDAMDVARILDHFGALNADDAPITYVSI